MKKYYEKPSMVIEKFEVEDIITTSSDLLSQTKVTISGGEVQMTLGENVLNSIDYTKFKLKN